MTFDAMSSGISGHIHLSTKTENEEYSRKR